MTTASNDRRVGPYVSDGAQTLFSYDFLIVDPTHLGVSILDSDGVETALNYGTDYSVSGTGSPNGGSFTLAVAPTAGYKVMAYGVEPNTQMFESSSSYGNPATIRQGFANVEAGMDRLAREIQQLKAQLDLCVRHGRFSDHYGVPVEIGDIPVGSEGKVLTVTDAASTPRKLAASALASTDLLAVGAFGEDLIAAATDVEARTDLGVLRLVPIAPVSLLAGSSGTTVDWGTPISIAAFTAGVTAKAARLRIQLTVECNFIEGIRFSVRKESGAPEFDTECGIFTVGAYKDTRTVDVDLTSSETFQWKSLVVGTPGSVTYKVDLEGYFL